VRTRSNACRTGAAFLLLALAACDGPGRAVTVSPQGAPTVRSNTPVNGATSVSLDGSVSATFSEAMDPATLDGISFTLTSGAAAVPVRGTVTYGDSKAVFLPAAPLARNGSYSATITTQARSVSGETLAAKRNWRFSTVKPRMLCRLGSR
jgi:hypothetical protein